MIDKLIEKYKNKIKDIQQDMYKNEIPLDFTEGFDENINPGEYTCYPIELWEEIMQDLEELKQSILNDDDLSINNEIGKIIRINTLIGVDTDE